MRNFSSILKKKNKADAIYNHCRSDLLREVGIKEDMFDNNAPETMNAALKIWLEGKGKDFSQVVSVIRGFVMKQRHDIGKAFSEMSGPYVLKEEYKDARLPTNFWSLKASTRKQLLAKVTDVPMKTVSINKVQDNSLSKEVPRLGAKFSEVLVDALKAKAERLLNGNIRQGFNGPKSRIIQSESGNQPHIVTCVNDHKYVCNTPCLQYKMHEICSHTLAAAADNQNLGCFVSMFLAKDKLANLTAGSIANTSRHAGKKPGHTSRKRNKGNKSVENLPKVTLGEVLRDIPPDCSQLQYTVNPTDPIV